MNDSKIQREVIFDPLTDYHSCNLQVREKYMLKLSENSAMKNIFVADREEVRGHWRKK
jgi:hypothetical protein